MRKKFLFPWGLGNWEDVSLELGQLSVPLGTDTLPEKGSTKGRQNLEMEMEKPGLNDSLNT